MGRRGGRRTASQTLGASGTWAMSHAWRSSAIKPRGTATAGEDLLGTVSRPGVKRRRGAHCACAHAHAHARHAHMRTVIHLLCATRSNECTLQPTRALRAIQRRARGFTHTKKVA